MAPQEKMIENQNGENPRISACSGDAEFVNSSDPVCVMRSNSNNGDGFVNIAFENDVALRHPEKSDEKMNTLKNNGEKMNGKEVTKSGGNGKKEDDDESMDFDDILPHIGEFGFYQKMLFLLMIPFAFFVAFVYFTQIFITLVPEEHWCWVPELANLTKEER